jgi:hypothetical protein
MLARPEALDPIKAKSKLAGKALRDPPRTGVKFPCASKILVIPALQPAFAGLRPG